MNEEELKKGCGKEAGFITFIDDFGNKDEDVMLCGDTTKKINGEIELFLCDTCQARLEGFQKAKNMFLEEIDKKLSNIDYSLDNLDNNEEFQDMEEYERDEYLSNLYGMRQGLQELKSKIGGEK